MERQEELAVGRRLLGHIEARTTDLVADMFRNKVINYSCRERAALERERRYGHALLRGRFLSGRLEAEAGLEEARACRALWRQDVSELAEQERRQDARAEARAEAARLAQRRRGGPSAELLSEQSASEATDDELFPYEEYWAA